MKPSVYIILVNYNGYADTLDCVKSLNNIHYDNFKIVIVDNKSTDDSVKIFKESLSEEILICSDKNLGFAGGNNLGIKYALSKMADYVLLLNNDTVVEKDFLIKMIDTISQDEKIGAVCCKILYHSNKDIIWFAGGYIDWFNFLGKHTGFREKDIGKYDIKRNVDFATGCVLLLSSEVISKAGYLPEEYFMYFEDVDYCIKIMDEGYKIIYAPGAVIYHKVGISGGGEDSAFSIKWGNRNRILLMDKYKSKVSKIRFFLLMSVFLSTRIIRYTKYAFSGNKDKAKALMEGIRDGLKIISAKRHK